MARIKITAIEDKKQLPAGRSGCRFLVRTALRRIVHPAALQRSLPPYGPARLQSRLDDLPPSGNRHIFSSRNKTATPANPWTRKIFLRLILPTIFCQQVPDLLFGLRPSASGTLSPFLFHESDLIARKARSTPIPKKTTGRIITSWQLKSSKYVRKNCQIGISIMS